MPRPPARLQSKGTPLSASADLSHAARQVAEMDRDRFVTALFAPVERREELMLLYAFNLEIARVRELVREPMAGMIRLQWWSDVLAAGMEGREVDDHPVARPLVEAARRRGVPVELFETLITARREDLLGEGPSTLAAAEDFAERSSAALTQAAARLLGGVGEATLNAARHVGIAWGLLGVVRALPHHLSMGRLTLPEEVLQAAGSSGEEVLAGRASTEVLTRAVRPLADGARSHLKAARHFRAERCAVPALLPAVLADGYLHVFEKVGGNPFDSRLSLPVRRPLRLLAGRLRGRF